MTRPSPGGTLARPRRHDHPGALHHVMNRGARRAPIFGRDEDCIAFLGIVADLPRRFFVRVHAYALMPNHYHLLLESERGGLSRAMQHLASEYTRVINARERWDGPMFRGRFTNRLVETDDYWTYLLFYLHLNAVRAHLAPDVDSVRWSSHRAYAGLEAAPEWLTTAPLLERVGGADIYRSMVREYRVGRRQPPGSWDAAALWRAPSAGTVPPAHAAAVDVGAELSRVSEVCGVTMDDLVRGGRGTGGNPNRWLAAWWLVAGCGVSNVVAARALGAGEAAVCRWVTRVGRGDDALLARRATRLQAEARHDAGLLGAPLEEGGVARSNA